MTRKRLEIALLITLALLFTYASAAGMQQQDIADKVLRLHVLANSDGAEDQRVKLCVRDRVLDYAEPLLKPARTQADVRRILGAHMQEIVDLAQQELIAQGAPPQVTAQIGEDYYPTRDYGAFALPAGRYIGLRIKIGAAEGQNWWCVIFPPLCDGAARTQDDGLTDDERAFTRRDGTQYVLRFKTAEIVGALRERLAG